MSEKQSYRDADDMPTERAVLEREWKAMRLALSMPRTPIRVDLIQCLKCQQFWTGPVDGECPHCNPMNAAAQASQPEAVGWVTAVQSFADELELPFLEAKSFLDEVFPQWMADQEAAGFVALRLDDLIEGDSYGVDGSDFYRCRICHAESGAGMLNNGIKHEHDCPLASAPTPEPMSAPTEAKPATQQASGEREIAGALFDFLGFLTTSERQWTFSSYDEASPAVEALEQWAKKRGLSLDEADVSGWRAALSTPAQQDAVDAAYEACAQIAFDADHMGSVNMKLMKNRIGNAIRAAISAKKGTL